MPTQSILSDEELAPLLQRKRELQANLMTQNSGGGSCGSSCSSGSSSKGGGYSAQPSASPQPNVVKAVAIAISVLAVSALAWWALVV